MSTLRKEDGVALISAITLLSVILGLGLGALMLGDNQQKAAAREQSSERAFAIAEAALNAQVGQLSRIWPTTRNQATVAPAGGRCTEALSNGANYCPPSIPLSTGYGTTSGTKCPAGTPADAWGAPITTPWATYVRSIAPSATYFNSKNEEGALDYAPESTKEAPELGNKLWVRAVGVANCRVVSLVTQVSRQIVSVPFPKDVLGGNSFETSNSGSHKGRGAIIEAGDPETGEPGEIGMRCEGLERGPGPGTCQSFQEGKEQILPSFNEAKTPPANPILNEEQVESVRALAEAKGTLFSAALGNCPTSTEQLSGAPAYVENCGNISTTSGTANSSTEPGFLVLANGTLTIKGNGKFYGAIYVRNPTNTNEALVTLGGSVTVVGAIEVDGRGALELGSSGVNVKYNPKAILELKGSAGAAATRNTFRVLPVSQ